MEQSERARADRWRAACLGLGCMILGALPASLTAQVRYQPTVQTLEARIAALEAKLANVSRSGWELRIVGNVSVVNGTNSETPNGLGNLTLGYNAPSQIAGAVNDRSGSHNLVLGSANSYGGSGCIVSGYGNRSLGGSVLGGLGNAAEGARSVIVGGTGNGTAERAWNSVLVGGTGNATWQSEDAIAGGRGVTHGPEE